MQTKKQAGFTLIELMIVVAIVGILAAVAIPAYQDYIKRSKVSELLGAMAACKTSVSETYSSNGNNLGSINSADDAGCNDTATQYMSTLTVNAGVITVTAQNIGDGVDNGTLTLTPNDNNGIIDRWDCAIGANIEPQYVPANCR